MKKAKIRTGELLGSVELQSWSYGFNLQCYYPKSDNHKFDNFRYETITPAIKDFAVLSKCVEYYKEEANES